MKMRLVTIQLMGVVMLVLAGLPFHVSHIDMITSCYAMGHLPPIHGNGNKHQVPEPTTLTLLQAGIGGAAVLYVFIRRNRK